MKPLAIVCRLALAAGLFVRGVAFADATQSEVLSSALSPSATPAVSPYPQFAAAQWLTVEGTKGRRFLTAIFRAGGTGPFPVVVVLPGADGLMEYYIPVAQDIARAGFVAVIGCYQAGTAPTAGTKLCAEATPEAEWISDPASNCGKEIVRFARTLPGVDSNRVAIYGMSRGGHAALWAASTGANVQAVVADAPAHTPQIPVPPAKPLVVLEGLSAPLFLMHGTADWVISVDQSHEYENAARAKGKQITVKYFDGAGHIVSIDPESRERARADAIDFLRRSLAVQAGATK